MIRMWIPCLCLAALVGCEAEEEVPPEDLDAASFLTQQEQDARAAEVALWLSDRSENWTIVDTRTSSDGQVIDYVTAGSLYPDAAMVNLSPPPTTSAPPNEDAPVAGESAPLTTFETDPSLVAPAGTIPVIRPDFAGYISGVGLPSDVDTIDEYIEVKAPTPAGVVNDRLYGTHRDTRNNIGTYGRINLWEYLQVGSADMSLLQTAILCYGTNFSTTLEAIEVGAQVNPLEYNDNLLHVFVYFRTAGTASGDFLGGYNSNQRGFVQYSGAAFPPGAAFAAGSLSQIDGNQYSCQFGAELYQGNWWVRACNTWLGYYPTDNSAVNEQWHVPFDLIDTSACEVQWYGEVADPTPSTWTAANMGSGLHAIEGWQRSAYIRQPFLRMTPTTSSWLASTLITSTGYNADCYSASSLFSNGGPGWERWFYVSGPGNNSSCQ
ncbi:MAG: neprosin family prolyl endopeptidase [Myxococcota bacterium]